MLGPSIRTVFTSRWKALMWSAGILLTAYCTVPGADESGSDAASAEQARKAEAALRAIAGGGASPQEEQPVNPWARDKD